MKTEILSLLPPDFPWRQQIQYYDSVPSTNDLAKQLAARGAPHGTVLIADHQTGGRGRMGRSFFSPAGMGIYMSVILRPKCAAQELMHLTCAVAVAMCDAIEDATQLRPGIKWTNDLMAGKKKLGGILTELAFDSSGMAYAIAGIGINCGQEASDFEPSLRNIATSLSMASGSSIDRGKLAAAMCRRLQQMDRHLLSGKQAMLEQYRKDCITLGQEISIVTGESIRHATALDIDTDGALLVRSDDGSIFAVNSGEVSVRGMYGYV